eukprot:6257388-Amphidinium_carterae.1
MPRYASFKYLVASTCRSCTAALLSTSGRTGTVAWESERMKLVLVRCCQNHDWAVTRATSGISADRGLGRPTEFSVGDTNAHWRAHDAFGCSH